jgi:hypothetical protein
MQRRKSVAPGALLRQRSAEQAAAEQQASEAPPPLPAANGLQKAVPPPQLHNQAVQRVRGMAEELVNQLDGLIEPSPEKLPRQAAQDDKSLREKLLESWDGKVGVREGVGGEE